MKTLKISLVATIAATLAWKLGIPYRIWPSHPQLADFLLALIMCVILQIAWTDPKKQPSDRSQL
jgi:hypothetical protein